ncbi:MULTISPECIES: hypothetical protein [Rhodococcus]|uniref:Uncharacterized protein n=1 Tax=Rhodococcus oxybenzonivorans TaxID=1990687 RepID=A0A2S2BQ26_9NOCA|nr:MULTISPECIES: hypothetical protein [Rhodococcus]AWK70711.1 hypothetical protein CBI38_03125 [Rhodococcus oxybenzonivorans]MDV7242825.1 hypothetical protein [Rhodococcus oxybenzonivorans]MDV7268169.1 hypothetical protein [Rhodococcus oxybenzonivorans]MDV7275229.1 hypothetical protein [Rhodococcus oxybenzonivorans]MDV7334916.1 hypothetical protein [Rhodococcus oxybenzonivorans]
MEQSTWPDNVRYAFLISGTLSERVIAAFPELDVSGVTTGDTTLYGRVDSPTDLRGMLARFDALGLTVIEMRRLPD